MSDLFQTGDRVDVILPGTDISHGPWTVAASAGPGWQYIEQRDADDNLTRQCRARETHLRHA